MKSACFIPIKQTSERVRGKNFKCVGSKELYAIGIELAVNSNVFDDVFVDTDSKEISDFAEKLGCKIIERQPQLAKNTANGNDLLNYHYYLHNDYDYYFQLFVTAPFLSVESVRKAHNILTNSNEYDSVFTAREHKGFFWNRGQPISYLPHALPRSQDLYGLVEETTGLYGIKKSALGRYHCRIGSKPYMLLLDEKESIDINTENDLLYANFIAQK